MFARPFSLKFFAKWQSRSSTEALRFQQIEASAINHAEKGVQHFLGLNSAAANELARAAQSAYQTMLQESKRANLNDAAHHVLAQVQLALVQALKQNSCLLALPLQVQALHLLRQLAQRSQRKIVIVETAQVRQIVQDMQLLDSCLVLKPSKEVIKLVKERTQNSAGNTANEHEHTLYISFPESHPFSAGTSTTLEFAGKAYGFSMLEPLLCVSGLPTLLSLSSDLSSDTNSSDMTLAHFSLAQVTDQKASAAMMTIATWLASQLQSCAQCHPAQSLAWQALFRASLHCRTIERSDKLKQLEAYFDVWKNSGTGLDLATHEMLKSRLQQLRTAK